MCIDSLPPSGQKRSHDNSGSSPDVEEIASQKKRSPFSPTVTKHTLTPSQPLGGSWRNVLGPPPERGTTKVWYMSFICIAAISFSLAWQG